MATSTEVLYYHLPRIRRAR